MILSYTTVLQGTVVFLLVICTIFIAVCQYKYILKSSNIRKKADGNTSKSFIIN